jgi:hypothetical protein
MYIIILWNENQTRPTVSLFRFKQKDAKRSEKDAKQNSTLARLSKTKQNKVRMTQFRLHEPIKTILNQKETCEK